MKHTATYRDGIAGICIKRREPVIYRGIEGIVEGVDAIGTTLVTIGIPW